MHYKHYRRINAIKSTNMLYTRRDMESEIKEYTDENRDENIEGDVSSAHTLPTPNVLEKVNELPFEENAEKNTEDEVQVKENSVLLPEILEEGVSDLKHENIVFENDEQEPISELDDKRISNSGLLIDKGLENSLPHGRDDEESVRTIEASTQIDAENDDEYSRDLPPELRLQAMKEYIATAREDAQTFVLIQVKHEKSHDGKSEKEHVHFRMEADLNPEWLVQQEEIKRQEEEAKRKELESTSWPKYTRGQSRLPKKRFKYTAPNKVLETVKQKCNLQKQVKIDNVVIKKELKPGMQKLGAVQHTKIKRYGMETNLKNAPKPGVKGQIKDASKIIKSKQVEVKSKSDPKKEQKTNTKSGVGKLVSKIAPKAVKFEGKNVKQAPVKTMVKVGSKVAPKPPTAKVVGKPVGKGIAEKIQKMTTKVPDKTPAKGVSGAKLGAPNKTPAKTGGQLKKVGVTEAKSGKIITRNKPSQVTSKSNVKDGKEMAVNKSKAAQANQSKINIKSAAQAKSKQPEVKRNIKEKSATNMKVEKKLPPKAVTKILPKQTIRPNKQQAVKKETSKITLKVPQKPAPTKQPAKIPAKSEPPKKPNKRDEKVTPKLEPKNNDSKKNENVAPTKNMIKNQTVKQNAPKEGPKRPVEKKQNKVVSKRSLEKNVDKNEIRPKDQNQETVDNSSEIEKLEIKSDDKKNTEVDEVNKENTTATELEKSPHKEVVIEASEKQQDTSSIANSLPDKTADEEVALVQSTPKEQLSESELIKSPTEETRNAEPEISSSMQNRTSAEDSETSRELESNQSTVPPQEQDINTSVQEEESTTSVQKEESITSVQVEESTTSVQEEESTTSVQVEESKPNSAVPELETQEVITESSEFAESQQKIVTSPSDNSTLAQNTTENTDDNLKIEEIIDEKNVTSPVVKQTSPPSKKEVRFNIFDHILSQVLNKTAEKEEAKEPEPPKPHICNKCGFKVTEYIEKEVEVTEENVKNQEEEESEIKEPEHETCTDCELTIIKQMPSPNECINCQGALGKNTKFELLFDVISKKFITTCSICKSLLGVVQKSRRQPLTPLPPSRGEVSSAFAEMVRRWQPSTSEDAHDGMALYNLSELYTTSYADEFQAPPPGPPIRPPPPANFPKRPRFLHKPAHTRDFKPPPANYKLDEFHGRRKFSGLGYVR